MTYDVTITRTGGICVEADTADEAVEKVKAMSVAEIEEYERLVWEDESLLGRNKNRSRRVRIYRI